MTVLVEQRPPTRSEAEFRPGMAAAFFAGVLIPAVIAGCEHGIAVWALSAISATVACVALTRIKAEWALVSGRTTTIATVTQWRKTQATEGGSVYSVRYRFFGPDNREFVGKQDSSVELPREGEMLPIAYNHQDPTQNIPLPTFWFYRFTYTGFASWMN